MRVISIEPVPNQSFSVRIDGSFYDFTIKESRGVMVVTISRDGVVIVSNGRMCSGSGLLPYPFMQKGNFVVITDNGELVDWQQFGNTQVLLYLTDEELAALPYPPEA